MFESLTDYFTDLVMNGRTYVFLLPIYGFLLVAERLTHAKMWPRQAWDNRDAAANIFITLVFLALGAATGHLLPLALMAAIFEWGCLFELPTGSIGWLLAFLFYDLAWFTDHRIAHRTGLFWAMHHVHHSSGEYNMTVSSRGFWLDNSLLPKPTFYLLPLLGVSPFHFVVVRIVTNIWGIMQHTRVIGKLGWLDSLFGTPSNHRVHHGSNQQYLDKNYGECLMIWDHLCGTYQPEQEEPAYGVTVPLQTYNPLKIELAGFWWLGNKIQSAQSWPDKIRCLYRPPEWLPNSTQNQASRQSRSAKPPREKAAADTCGHRMSNAPIRAVEKAPAHPVSL